MTAVIVGLQPAGRFAIGAVATALLAVYGAEGHSETVQAPLAVRATRLPQNPLVTVATSASLGDNVNGPTVIRVPDWVERPRGRSYMYFAHHMGAFVRLAYADRIEGPWKIHDPGVLPVRETAFFRPQPDPPENLENFYTHVASPEVLVDHQRRRLVMWVHGWWTEGTRWPIGEVAAREWAAGHGYGQYTQSAVSADGVRFEVQPPITRTSYLRVFPFGGYLYGMARLGLLLRSLDPPSTFEPGPNPFRDTPYAGRVRHVAVLRRESTLYVFFTAIGDAPERVMVSTIDLSADWRSWKASPAVTVLEPAAPYECPSLPIAPSLAGDIKAPARQLRDPFAFEENGRALLFYSICGEQGIAAAELALP
jgi:hypothetical protein